jgi:HKD family nuclease
MLIHQNTKKKNHRKLLADLIEKSDRSVLCSGWLNLAGLVHLLPSIDHAIGKGATVVIYSNKRHTDMDAAEELGKRALVRHYIADDKSRYLHTKLFYFESGEKYTAIVGSANITEGGLIKNEELSIEINGMIGDASQEKIQGYLESLPARLST